MTKEQLMPFCSQDETRYGLQQPFTNGDYTYASDGRLMIRVPAIPDCDGNEFCPKSAAEAQPWHFINGATYGPLPPATLYGDQVPCECENCGNKHTRTNWKRVKIANRIANGEFLAMISHLPDIVIDVAEVEDVMAPFAFRFTGGEGLLMPIRKP